MINREINCERPSANTALGHNSGSQVVLLSPRNDSGRLPAARDRGTRRAYITEVDSYSSSVFAELGDFLKVTVDRRNAVTEVY
jgi:hypothetical protein